MSPTPVNRLAALAFPERQETHTRRPANRLAALAFPEPE